MIHPQLDPNINVVRVPVELLKKIEQSVEKVHERMIRTARALGQAGVPFAVIGGNAVAIWVESVDEGAGRNTKDVDILLDRGDLARAVAAMRESGFEHVDVHGVSMFIEREDPMPSRAVHVVFASEKVRPHDLHAAPPVICGIRNPEGVSAVDLRGLLTMKLVAFRLIDQAHIADLCRVGLISDELRSQIPPDLRTRLEEILAHPDG